MFLFPNTLVVLEDNPTLVIFTVIIALFEPITVQ